MANVIFKNVFKKFDENIVLNNINLEIDDGEFISLLGPSGCGKTTLLRIIAGFENVSDGELYIDNKLYSSKTTNILPENRNIAMVFQSYALWPHMSVWENVAFGLKLKKMPKKEIEKKVNEALEIVGLNDYKNRKPSELSGGQKQRVALARCMAMEPSIILFDEPLANLDVNLKESMLEEFKNFHKRLKCSMIYVTHDQSEAMSLSDKIAVIDKGVILQYASPIEIYNKPNSKKVATFVGNGVVLEKVNVVEVSKSSAKVKLFEYIFTAHHNKNLNNNERVDIALKSENLEISNTGIEVIVESVIYQGNYWKIKVYCKNNKDIKLYLNKNNKFEINDKFFVQIKDGWII